MTGYCSQHPRLWTGTGTPSLLLDFLCHEVKGDAPDSAHGTPWATASAPERHARPFTLIFSCCTAHWGFPLAMQKPFPTFSFTLKSAPPTPWWAWGWERVRGRGSSQSTRPGSPCFLCGLTVSLWIQCLFSLETSDTLTLPKSNDSSITYRDKKVGTGDLDYFLSTSVWGGNVCPLRTISDSCFKWNGRDIKGARCSASTNCYSMKRQID